MRKIISTFALHETAVKFFVEAFLKAKWKQVRGPFNDRTTAENAALAYAIKNHVKTRVVGEN
jgi:hypothetical protein